MNKFLKHKKYIIQTIRYVNFSKFGIRPNDEFYFNIANHIKTFDSCDELEKELNKLVSYIYYENRKIFFHEFRQFPYINHGKDNSSDICGYATNYTSSDIYLIKFIKNFLECKNGVYKFFDVDYIIKNSERVQFEEHNIIDMPIDEILR